MTTETHERTDKRLTISMSAADHGRLVKLQEALEAYTASEVVRTALRALERQLEAQKAKKGKRPNAR